MEEDKFNVGSSSVIRVKASPQEEEAYAQGLRSGYTKSIVLIRHMQRTLSPTNVYSVSGWEILEEAMELISKEIKVNNE